jgi:RNA polymerase sigma-70 factor (ECF subfamily)
MDDSVLQRIAAGDAKAVQECIDQYSRLVWSIARRFAPSPAEAEDAVQEVFLDLWKSASRFDPARASETTFVAMVARRRLIDLLRRGERRPQLTAIPENFDFADDEQERLEVSVEASMAARALKVLKPEQRRVLVMSVYHGMSHGEIVESTGMPLGTVKSHIRRGLSEIRAALGQPEPGAVKSGKGRKQAPDRPRRASRGPEGQASPKPSADGRDETGGVP